MLAASERMNCEVIQTMAADNRAAAVVRVTGALDLTTVDELRGAIRESLTVPAPACLVVDLKDATHIDSSGIGMLLEGLRNANQRHVSFVLCGLNGMVRHIFERTRLNQLFDIRPTSEEALLDLAAAPC